MDEIDVGVLKLGIDAAARDEVQAAMDEIARSGDTGGPEGLLRMLREAIAVIRGVEDAWSHGAVQSSAPMPPQEAEARFEAAAQDARGRFDDEVIRASGGRVETRPGGPLSPSVDPSMVVVTFVVAARRELPDIDVIDRGGFAFALDELAALRPEDFVALEVVWSPADPADRPSVTEVERNYPELVAFAPRVA
jgi:uncharacterized membrane protein